jgi:hypothetical protein
LNQRPHPYQGSAHRLVSPGCTFDLGERRAAGDRWRPLRTARLRWHMDQTWTRHVPLAGAAALRVRGPWLARQAPAGCPRQASPAMTIALVGGALAGSGPGTSPCIDGPSLTTGMVVPSTLRVQTVRTTMVVLKDCFARCKSTRQSACKRLLCSCFGHSRELWFFGLLRVFLNGWTELAKRVGHVRGGGSAGHHRSRSRATVAVPSRPG